MSLKAAWRAYLQARRRHGRRTGDRGEHRDRAGLERALECELERVEPAALADLKTGLRDLVHGGLGDDAAGTLAARLDRALTELVGAVATEPVEVRVRGWPAGLSRSQRGALMGLSWADSLLLSPGQAAALVRALHGRVIGGARLQVQVDLPPGRRLPAPPRTSRDQGRRSGRTAWLPHLDETGRYSLTPRELAEQQVADLPTPVVVDAFCGCGGNAIAFALAGRRVIAIERDAGRLELARANARALGATVDLRLGDAADRLEELGDQAAAAGLFLDPPWGGPGASRDPVGWAELVPLELESLAAFDRVALKAPASFDVGSLPPRWRWTWRFELSPPGADGRCAVIAITCRGVRPAADGVRTPTHSRPASH